MARSGSATAPRAALRFFGGSFSYLSGQIRNGGGGEGGAGGWVFSKKMYKGSRPVYGPAPMAPRPSPFGRFAGPGGGLRGADARGARRGAPLLLDADDLAEDARRGD